MRKALVHLCILGALGFVAVPLTGCPKKETTEEKVEKATEGVQKAVEEGAKAIEDEAKKAPEIPKPSGE